jgi:oxygen-independent coproporphyrinogen-3 oxidase
VRTYELHTGLPAHTIAEEVIAAERKGLLDRTSLGWRPSELGQRFLNDLQQMFLPTGRLEPRSN